MAHKDEFLESIRRNGYQTKLYDQHVHSESVFDELKDNDKVVYGYSPTMPLNKFEETELKTNLDKTKIHQ